MKFERKARTNEIYKDEVLISNLNPKNLKGIERRIFNHELIYLNPNYKDEDTPKNYRDWLDLIYESIHNPKKPNINLDNEGIKRVVDIIDYKNITPEELELAKIEASKREVIVLEREDEKITIARNLMELGFDDKIIKKATGLSIEKIKGQMINKCPV